MQHLILAIITIGIVRFAWVNFKKLGALRTAGGDVTSESQQLQMRYIMRIVFCLIALACAPFVFTVITK